MAAASTNTVKSLKNFITFSFCRGSRRFDFLFCLYIPEKAEILTQKENIFFEAHIISTRTLSLPFFVSYSVPRNTNRPNPRTETAALSGIVLPAFSQRRALI